MVAYTISQQHDTYHRELSILTYIRCREKVYGRWKQLLASDETTLHVLSRSLDLTDVTLLPWSPLILPYRQIDKQRRHTNTHSLHLPDYDFFADSLRQRSSDYAFFVRIGSVSVGFQSWGLDLLFSSNFATCQSCIGWEPLVSHLETTSRHS